MSDPFLAVLHPTSPATLTSTAKTGRANGRILDALQAAAMRSESGFVAEPRQDDRLLGRWELVAAEPSCGAAVEATLFACASHSDGDAKANCAYFRISRWADAIDGDERSHLYRFAARWVLQRLHWLFSLSDSSMAGPPEPYGLHFLTDNGPNSTSANVERLKREVKDILAGSHELEGVALQLMATMPRFELTAASLLLAA